MFRYSVAVLITHHMHLLNCRPEKEAEQLASRQKVRQAIMAGHMTDAQDLLHKCHPDMLESVTHPNLDVLIFFHCLHYIELIRWDSYPGYADFAVNPASTIEACC